MKKMDYRQAGVDIKAGEEAVQRIKNVVKSTFNANVLSELGSFGGLFRIPQNLTDPILVASTDGVGTKLKIAIEMKKFGTVGQDLVNHCVDDILVQGAQPLFFLDYIGINKIYPEEVEQIIDGFAYACKQNGTALIGGEMAEMPDIYQVDDFDLAGTIVGVVEKDKLITGANMQPGDILIGMVSTGLHTNGYTLARKVLFEQQSWETDSYIEELGTTLGEALLWIHRSYYPLLKPLIDQKMFKGLAHITGGGIPGNLKRIVPETVTLSVNTQAWEIPPLFQIIQEAGNIETEEMYRAFNMGIGMIAVVAPENADAVLQHTNGILLGQVGPRRDQAVEMIY